MEVSVLTNKPHKKIYTKEELEGHKLGKDYVARKLAEQETLGNYDDLDADNIPSHLCYFGKKEWKRIIPLLKQLPIAELDRELIEDYCILHGNSRRLNRDIQKDGTSIKEYDEDGNLINSRRNPDYDIWLQTVRESRMIQNLLGMTMSSRLDLAIPDPENEEDEVLKLLKGG